MTADLTGKKIAFLVDNAGVEQVELTTPWRAFRRAGAETTLIAPEKDVVQAFNNDVEEADTFGADLAVTEADAEEYDALVPGGTTNADAGKPIAAICHGPWALVEADVLDGKRLTSYPSLKTDIRNAGGVWVQPQPRRPRRVRGGGRRGVLLGA